MRITLELPDNTIRIKYTTGDGGASESKDKAVTLGMIVGVANEKAGLPAGLATITGTPCTNKNGAACQFSIDRSAVPPVERD